MLLQAVLVGAAYEAFVTFNRSQAAFLEKVNDYFESSVTLLNYSTYLSDQSGSAPALYQSTDIIRIGL